MQAEAGGYTMFTKDGKHVAAASPPPPGTEGVPPHWSTYIASDDVDATAARSRDAGGTVLMEPFDVFDSGRMAIAAGSGRRRLRHLAGARASRRGARQRAGLASWNECQTGTRSGRAKFYSDVFGYEIEEAEMGEGPPYRVLKVDGRGVAGMIAMTPEMADVPPNWSTTFAVEDADAAVEEGGMSWAAACSSQPFDIPTVGRYAVIQDPAGVVFGILAG